jgi:predicted flap endonuclease-1-like 5' DNA nuclease
VVQPDEPVKKAPAKKGAAKKAPAKKAPVKKVAPDLEPEPQAAEQVTPAAPQPLPPAPAPKLATPVATTTSLPPSGEERSRLPLLAGVGVVLLLVLRKLRRR